VAVAVTLLPTLALLGSKSPVDRLKRLGETMTVTAKREGAHARVLELLPEIERESS